MIKRSRGNADPDCAPATAAAIAFWQTWQSIKDEMQNHRPFGQGGIGSRG